MMSLKSILSLFVLLMCLGTLTVAKKEEEDSALRDLQIGMQGLKEAASNPAMMAQLMRDLAVRVSYAHVLPNVSPTGSCRWVPWCPGLLASSHFLPFSPIGSFSVRTQK